MCDRCAAQADRPTAAGATAGDGASSPMYDTFVPPEPSVSQVYNNSAGRPDGA